MTIKTIHPTAECVNEYGFCITHQQQIAACEQMKHGNLCSGCKEHHTKDYKCGKVN